MSDFLGLRKSNCKNCYKCIRHCPVKSINFPTIRRTSSQTSVSCAANALSTVLKMRR